VQRLGLLLRKVALYKKVMKRKKIRCTLRPLCYSLPMQANSLINDDFNTQIQSDEFASEYEAYLDEQEKNYWREIDAQGN
jgi:hypothetical protein